MKCVNPRKLINPAFTNYTNYYINVSCGKCYACLANRRRGWLFRLMHENLNSVITLFVTLTYDDLNVLRDANNLTRLYLKKSDLQNFFKRLRNYEQFKYYAIGEYGTHTLRPHYHCVLFFKSAPSYNTLDELNFIVHKCWNFGFCSVSRASYRRLNYVLHYHVRPKQIDSNRQTFCLFSKGLGISFLSDNIIDYLVKSKRKSIKDYNGHSYVIPRYYRKKLINLGFDLDPPDMIYDLDSSRSLVEKHFGKPIYQIPETDIFDFLRDRVICDKSKLDNYNKNERYR